ncbi:MAG: hypothetical protein KatS3mg118_1192 [Paracoccaceae bacterium]|nr:MAG: hypothetical protein KatS3mg118_1192 [Paracoccaceae bacterium]
MQRAPIADAQPCAAPEKVRVGLGGPVAIVTGRGETTLRPPDFCRIDPGQRGAIVNRPALPASMPVVVPLAGREGG